MPKQSPIKGLPATKSLPIIPPIVPEADPNVPVPPPARPVRGKGAATTVPPAAPTTATATSSKAYGKKKAKTIIQEDTIPHIAPNTAPESSIAPALRSVNAKISLVNKRIDELEAVRLADIAARLHKVEEDDVVILADRLDIVETSNEGFGERLTKLEKASESMWTRMNDMQANVSRIDSTVNKMKDEVGLALDTANWARTTADEIQDSVDHAKEDISSIYPAVQSLEALNGEMSELRGRVDFLSGSVNAVRGSITNISKVSGSAPVAPSFPTTTHSPPNPHYPVNPSPPSALPIRTPQLRPSRESATCLTVLLARLARPQALPLIKPTSLLSSYTAHTRTYRTTATTTPLSLRSSSPTTARLLGGRPFSPPDPLRATTTRSSSTTVDLPKPLWPVLPTTLLFPALSLISPTIELLALHACV